MRSILLALGLLLGLAAPTFASPSDNTLRIGLREDPDILDPTLGGSYVGRIVFAGMCDKLFDYDTKLNIVPQLATGYEYKDPTHLVLHLRSGVLFQDGEKFDAAAVKYTLNRDLTMARSLRKGQINDIDSISVIDPLTVELVLKQPNAALLAQLAGRPGIMVAPDVAEKEGADFGQHPVCAGPFKFVQRIAQQKIVLERFKRYWNAQAIHFDKVEYIPIVNSAVRLANLQAGALDLVEYIVPTDVPAVQKDPKLRIEMDTSLAYQGITFNTGNGAESKTPIGSNAKLRRAFELAISREALIHVVYNGLYTAIAQANPPSSQFYVPSVAPPQRDLKAAQALVAASGVKPPIAVTLLVPNSPDTLQAAQVIQAMVQPAGFDVKIRAMEFASSLAAARSGDFQAYLIGWSGRADADGNMYSFLHSNIGFNYGHYANPEVDTLLDQGRAAPTVAERRAVYAKLWAVERADMPVIYLWSPKNIVGLQKTVQDFRQVPDGIIRLQGMAFGK
jgi:peptide/nickel transport system substrate-binding protein